MNMALYGTLKSLFSIEEILKISSWTGEKADFK